jgi:hypothetical protein
VPAPLKGFLRPAYRRLAGRRPRGYELPPEVPEDDEKHAIIRDYARRFGSRILVETGTYEGDTVAATRGAFERIYTIELDPELQRLAHWRFVLDRRVRVLRGDSAEELERVLPRLGKPTLFWLDAHYSRGGVPSARGKYDPPLLFELDAILALREPRHVILIDDARLCGTEPGYPPLAEIERVVQAADLGLVVSAEGDIVRIHAPDRR